MPEAPTQTDDHLAIIKKIERVLDAWDNGSDRQVYSGFNPNMNKATVVFQMLRDNGLLRNVDATGS